MKFTGVSYRGLKQGERYERMRAGFSNHEIYRGLKLRHPYTDADRVLVTMKFIRVSNGIDI